MMQWLVNMCVKMNTCVKINMCAISGRRGPVTNMNKLSYEHVVSLMIQDSTCSYGVATISRLLEIIGLFCKRALQKRSYSAKKTCHFKEPTNRSPISTCCNHIYMLHPYLHVATAG